jgi:hypothetical protein
MNADYRNGVSHTVASQLPEPSRNGPNGGLLDAEAPSANGAGETGPSPSGNGANGQTARLLESSRAAGEPSPSGNGANGRDASGRFVKGNPGGPGNPFARRAAQLRRVLSMAVSDEDIEAVAHVLLEKAKAGDVAAARLLLSYAIGQPTAAVDPDTLDQQEWAIFRQVPVPAPEVERLLHDVPVDFACELARALAPHLGQITAHKVKSMLAEPGPATRKQAKRGKRRKTRALALERWQRLSAKRRKSSAGVDAACGMRAEEGRAGQDFDTGHAAAPVGAIHRS